MKISNYMRAKLRRLGVPRCPFCNGEWDRLDSSSRVFQRFQCMTVHDHYLDVFGASRTAQGEEVRRKFQNYFLIWTRHNTLLHRPGDRPIELGPNIPFNISDERLEKLLLLS